MERGDEICSEEALLQLARAMGQLTRHSPGDRDDSPLYFLSTHLGLLVFGFETRRKTSIT